ncbi:hypothetical protein SOPP22_17740 [Shewanella sp. OPT22]|nr:hypothetical protein SOPP22_17740 [Shewanella sp. OPT22]
MRSIKMLGARELRNIPFIYVTAAIYCMLYWFIWFVPFTTVIIGTDGAWFLMLGTVSLFLLPVIIIGWAFPSMRYQVISRYGKYISHSCFAVITVFFLWGAGLWLSLYIYGV